MVYLPSAKASVLHDETAADMPHPSPLLCPNHVDAIIKQVIPLLGDSERCR